MTSSDKDILKLPELTEKIIYGHNGETVLPIAVSNVRCLIRRTALVFSTESVNIGCGLAVQTKDSSDPIQISPMIEDESYWDEVHEFALKKGISYEIQADSDPYPDIRIGALIWEPETPFSTPERVTLCDPDIFSVRGFLLYKEHRGKPFTTTRVDLFEYSFGRKSVSPRTVVFPSIPFCYMADMDRRFAENVVKLIPIQTGEKLKELFSPEKKED